jgi:hypothetical protein
VNIVTLPDGRSIDCDPFPIIETSYTAVTTTDIGIILNFLQDDGVNLSCPARVGIAVDRVPMIAAMLVSVADYYGLDWQAHSPKPLPTRPEH